MTDETEIAEGHWVRVKDHCPLTLPYYARVAPGQVVGVEGDCMVVEFMGGRVFPVPLTWLEHAPTPK